MNKSDKKLKERALFIQSQYRYYTEARKFRHVAVVELIAENLFISVGTVEKDLRKTY